MAFDLSRFGLEEDLPSGWSGRLLGDLAFFNPEQIGRDYPYEQIQYLDIGNVTAGAIGAPVSVPRRDAPSRAQRIVQDGDTVISTVRPGNRAFAFLRKPPDSLIVSTGFAVLRAKPGVNTRFLFYLSTCNSIIEYLATIAEEKSAYPSVKPSDIAECRVPVPPLAEQRAIAHILGTLDDKIELNRRMSETLEAMARALFKSWFVDFLPVRAKMAANANDPSLLLPQVTQNTWYVYAIECNNGSLYIGQTENLRQRWLQHAGGKGASWTKQHTPVRVPYWEKQPSRKAAIEREKWLKTGFGRKWLKQEIAARTQTGDPVRAKMEGRLPAPSEARQAGWKRGQSLPLPAPPSEAARQAGGLPAHLYDLFPDRFVDSELGEIPEGWEAASLPDLIDVNPARQLRKGQVAPYLDMANMPTRGHAPDEVIERPFGSGMRFVNGDTLVARITPCLENGKTAFVDFLEDGQVAWGSTEYIVLRPKQPLPVEFAYCLARSAEFREFAIQSMTGTSGRQRVQADSLAHFGLPRVPEPVAEAFGRAITPLFVRSSAAVRESRTLAALRDALLPKLISGELRVTNSVKFIKGRM